MLRVSKLTDYATVLMTCLAADADGVMSAQQLAEQARLEPPTAAKLLKLLGKAGLVTSYRGATGGYKLARAPSSITVADIVAAIEGPIGMTECSVHVGACGHESHCNVRVNWRKISVAIESALRGVTLADMLVTSTPDPQRQRKSIPLRLERAEASS